MKVLEQLESLVSTKVEIMKAVFSLFKLEARLAGLSVYPLVLNVCMLFTVLLTLWSVTMLLLGYGLFLACNSILVSIVCILLFNLGLFLGLLKYLTFNLKQMSFEKTRAYFSKDESPNYDKLEKAADDSNSAIGQDNKVPAQQNSKK